ncbi:MAG: hypothetical protein H0W63_06790 [Gemmatimonadaceae bacterium]|nr:hypothetical protein [Gemmatimonadaceae bacterium]
MARKTAPLPPNADKKLLCSSILGDVEPTEKQTLRLGNPNPPNDLDELREFLVTH